MLIFAVESSCDETSLCLMKSNGEVLSHKIASQEIHNNFGGVVPELASRSHLLNLQSLYKKCLTESEINPKDIDIFCSTCGPGLIGCLLVGSTFVKSLSIGFQKPFYAINHLEAHILSPTINNKIIFPYLCVLLTGGHTQIYLVNGVDNYSLLGETKDDALGEAFDKVAKLLNLPYPGGPAIEEIAKNGSIKSVSLPHPLEKSNTLDFSFSGIKTAVNLYVKNNIINQKIKNNIAASFQHKVTEILKHKITLCFNKFNNIKIDQLAIVGGVGSNKYIFAELKKMCSNNNVEIILPPKDMFSDNAAMIAWTCIQKLSLKNFQEGLHFKNDPRLRVGIKK